MSGELAPSHARHARQGESTGGIMEVVSGEAEWTLDTRGVGNGSADLDGPGPP